MGFSRQKKFSFLISHLSFCKGFTLIELLIAVSIISTLSVIGIAGFVNYSRSQTVNNAALDIANMLQVARSYASSQVSPKSTITGTDVCNLGSINKYKVIINFSEKKYSLVAVCAGNDTKEIQSKKLPNNLSFNSGSEFIFPIFTGGVLLPPGASDFATIIITGFGIQRKVNIDANGHISVGN